MDLLQFRDKESEKFEYVLKEIKALLDANQIKFAGVFIAGDNCNAITNFKYRHESIGAAKIALNYFEGV